MMEIVAKAFILCVCFSNVFAFRLMNSHHSILKNAQLHASAALGFDTHKAVDQIPESLVKSIDGNAGMRKKFETLCRTAQVSQLIL